MIWDFSGPQSTWEPTLLRPLCRWLFFMPLMTGEPKRGGSSPSVLREAQNSCHLSQLQHQHHDPDGSGRKDTELMDVKSL